MSESNSSETVEYRPIPGLCGYQAGSDGSIWYSVCQVKRGVVGDMNDGTTWRRRCPERSQHGYQRLTIRVPGRRIRRFVHHLILETFCGPRPEGYITRHLDGTRQNNRLDNLAWGTHAENHEDMKRHGRRLGPTSEHSRTTKLTAEDVMVIRHLASQGVTYADIAKQFPVRIANISHIVLRRRWKTVP